MMPGTRVLTAVDYAPSQVEAFVHHSFEADGEVVYVLYRKTEQGRHFFTRLQSQVTKDPNVQ